MEIKCKTRLKNRYEIVKKIGEGGFGATYKAVDGLTNRYVAIKCSTMSLQHEANILKEINNLPHICHMYDYFVIDKQHFIVMRLVEGESLYHYVEKHGGTLSVADLKRLLPSVFITLDQMHSMGIIHRDISPGNFLLNQEDTLYLIDFGAATSLHESKLKNPLVFRHKGLDSPEQADITKQGPWTDLYSLCSTIVYLLTGEGVQDAATRQQFDPVPAMLVRLSLSAKMQNALLKGLSINPQHRYDSVMDFAKDFLGTVHASDMQETYQVHYHAKTHIGTRDINQDNFMVDTLFAYAGEDCEIKGNIACDKDTYHVVAIADGVASVLHAELASKAAIQAVSHFIDQHQESEVLPEKLLEDFMDQLNEKILTLSQKIGKTATTISVMLWKNDRYCVANIGDSPIYRLSGKKLMRLSQEQTVAREKLDHGVLASKEEFHMLAKYLGKKGVAGSQMAGITTGTMTKGDIFLLCSDGVAGSLSERQKIRYMQMDGDVAMKKIYDKCKKQPQMDNCTAVILKLW